MGFLLCTEQRIFTFEIDDSKIWLKEVVIPDTGVAGTKIWLHKAFKHGDVGRLKQSLAEKKKLLSLLLPLSFSLCLPPSLPPSFLLMHIKGTVGGNVWVMHPVYKVTN